MEYKPNIYQWGHLFISRWDALLCLWNKQVCLPAHWTRMMCVSWLSELNKLFNKFAKYLLTDDAFGKYVRTNFFLYFKDWHWVIVLAHALVFFVLFFKLWVIMYFLLEMEEDTAVILGILFIFDKSAHNLKPLSMQNMACHLFGGARNSGVEVRVIHGDWSFSFQVIK